MKPVVKEILIKALLSEKYKQHRGQLRTDQGFSILGVICDLYDPKLWKKDCEEGMALYKEKGWYYIGHIGILPPKVSTWAGLGFQGESWGADLEHKRILNLGHENECMNFKELAQAIQNHTPLWSLQTIPKYNQKELSFQK